LNAVSLGDNVCVVYPPTAETQVCEGPLGVVRIFSILSISLLSILGMFSAANLFVTFGKHLDFIAKLALGFLAWIFSVSAWGKTQRWIDVRNPKKFDVSLGFSMQLMLFVWLSLSVYLAAAAVAYKCMPEKKEKSSTYSEI
jgi:predicted tellurium resistance membrane protein TerC